MRVASIFLRPSSAASVAVSVTPAGFERGLHLGGAGQELAGLLRHLQARQQPLLETQPGEGRQMAGTLTSALRLLWVKAFFFTAAATNSSPR